VSARGVRTVGNMLAWGAGRSVAVLEGARARLGSAMHRRRGRRAARISDAETAHRVATGVTPEQVVDPSAVEYEMRVDDFITGGEDVDELDGGGEPLDELSNDARDENPTVD
jgi:hypothetical protein